MADLEKKGPADGVASPAEDDTRTRKTVKLGAPTAAAVPKPVPLPAVPASGAAPAAGDGADTKTRKTIKLKPVVPADHQPIPIESLTGKVPKIKLDKAGAPVMPADDTRTQKTVKVAPAAPAAPVVSAGEDTRTRKTVKLAPPAPDAKPEVSSETIKVQKPAVAPSAAPSSGAKINLRPAPQTASSTMQKTTAPKTTARAATPDAAKADQKTGDDGKKTRAVQLAKEAPKQPPRAEAELAKMEAEKKAADAKRKAVSPVYTAFAVITFIAVVFALVFTYFSYTNTWQPSWNGGSQVSLLGK